MRTWAGALAGATVVVGATAPTAHAIVGGEVTSAAWPAVGQLRIDGEFSCGVNLVRPDWALTAAHCVEGIESPRRFSVTLGRRTLAGAGGETIAVDAVRQHEHYGWRSDTSHDIALLHLAKPAAQPPLRVITPAEAAERTRPGTATTVLGWGATSDGGPVSNRLREVRPAIGEDGFCSVASGLTVGYDRQTMLCAGELLGGHDACNGDSGGPLLVADRTGALVLGGLVSSGFSCALATQYGVYTRVGGSELHGWLARHLPAAGAAPVGHSARASAYAVPAGPLTTARIGRGDRPLAIAVRRVRGSLRRATSSRRAGRRSRWLRLTVSVRASTRARRTRLTVRRGRRVVARTRRSRLRHSTTRLALRLHPSARRSRLTIAVAARDRSGRIVRASRRVRLRR